MGSSFQAFLSGLLEWVALFRDFGVKKINCPKVTKMKSLIGPKTDHKIDNDAQK